MSHLAPVRMGTYTCRMPISFACNCGKRYKTPDDAAGKKLRCKSCGEAVRVPGGKTRKPSGENPVPKKVSVPDPVSDDIGFADEDRPVARDSDLYQGPAPDEMEEHNPAAVLYGTNDEKKTSRKNAPQALFLPWVVILGATLVFWGVMKFYVIQ